MKKLNYYYGMDACLAFFILLMFCKNAKDSWYVGGAIVGVMFFIMAYFSQNKVTNKTNNYVNAKPENASKPIIGVTPGTEYYGFDGIKVGNKVLRMLLTPPMPLTLAMMLSNILCLLSVFFRM